jgi:putative transport protein
MVDFIIQALRNNPELAIFLTLAIGFLVGRIKFGSFSLGIVVGTLLAGILIGQLDIKIPSIVKTIFFDLFLFTTGYKVGPQFFRGLKSDAIPQVTLAVVLCVTCLMTSFGFSMLLGYDVGTAAGLLAGAFSESTVIGTAGEAIQRLGLPDTETTALLNNIPVAYAVTYLIGTASLVWFLPTIGPKLMGINLRDEGARMQMEIAIADQLETDMVSAKAFDTRAYRVTNPDLVNRSVAELEALPQNVRVFIVRIRHCGEIIEHLPSSVIRLDDVVAILARREVHAERGRNIGIEVDDRALLDIPIDVLDVVVTNRSLVGITLSELARLEPARGVFVRSLTRAGQEMHIAASTRIDRGDVLRLVGTTGEVELAAKELGYPDRPTAATDMVFVGAGIALGGVVGLLSVNIGGVPLSLTTSGGALMMGLLFGWLRSVYSLFGRIPEPAIWIFDNVGLCIFIGVVGLSAGPSFLAGLQKTGASLVAVRLVSALLPHTLGILFGRYVLKMNPLVVLGACAGAGTITAALRAVQDEARSSIPALGYPVPYALGHIMLTAWGPILVTMMTIGE